MEMIVAIFSTYIGYECAKLLKVVLKILCFRFQNIQSVVDVMTILQFNCLCIMLSINDKYS